MEAQGLDYKACSLGLCGDEGWARIWAARHVSAAQEALRLYIYI